MKQITRILSEKGSMSVWRTRQKAFIRVILSHQNLLHTLDLADFLHNLRKCDLLHYTFLNDLFMSVNSLIPNHKMHFYCV